MSVFAEMRPMAPASPTLPVIEVAVVEDNADVALVMGRRLRDAGMRPHLLGSAHELDQCLEHTACRIVVLDLGLPDEDGLSIARRLASRPDVHVIVLTGRTGAAERLAGFEAGADYYYEKPANLTELVAVIRRIDRRMRQAPTAWSLERHRRRLVSPDGVEIPLTDQESRFLWLLGQAPERSVSREVIEHGLWQESSTQTARRLEVMVHRFRRKLSGHGVEDDPIQTRWRTGYGFGPPLALVSGEDGSATMQAG